MNICGNARSGGCYNPLKFCRRCLTEYRARLPGALPVGAGDPTPAIPPPVREPAAPPAAQGRTLWRAA
jgi:hypothetical protein